MSIRQKQGPEMEAARMVGRRTPTSRSETATRNSYRSAGYGAGGVFVLAVPAPSFRPACFAWRFTRRQSARVLSFACFARLLRGPGCVTVVATLVTPPHALCLADADAMPASITGPMSQWPHGPTQLKSSMLWRTTIAICQGRPR